RSAPPFGAASLDCVGAVRVVIGMARDDTTAPDVTSIGLSTVRGPFCRLACLTRLFALDVQLDLRDVGTEEQRDRPVEDDPSPRLQSRHLKEIVRPANPPRRKTRQANAEDARDGARVPE